MPAVFKPAHPASITGLSDRPDSWSDEVCRGQGHLHVSNSNMAKRPEDQSERNSPNGLQSGVVDLDLWKLRHGIKRHPGLTERARVSTFWRAVETQRDRESG
jgi:hypothetical protein